MPSITIRSVLAGLTLVLCLTAAQAMDLSRFNSTDLSAALRSTLSIGGQKAIASLGVENGFLANSEVRIGLPPELKKRRRLLNMFGMEESLNNLEVSMNRAAEAAIPEARALVEKTVKNITVKDARQILEGGDTAVTDYFREKTSSQLFDQLKPLVAEKVSQIGLAQQYNQVAKQAFKYGFLKEEDASVESHVTGEALDGLFKMIGKEEQQLRANPMEAGTRLLRRVFGS